MNTLSFLKRSFTSTLQPAKFSVVKLAQPTRRSFANNSSVSTKRNTSSLQSGLQYILFGIAWIGLDVAMYYILQYNRANPAMKRRIIEEIEREEREAGISSH